MVKVRGHRVELGDVEAALCETPGVREAAVVAVPDLLGQKILKAVVVGEISGLAAALRERLPEYMVPSNISFAEALPRTATGKLDYAALTGSARGDVR